MIRRGEVVELHCSSFFYSYATTFDDNRITKEMLMDLNKVHLVWVHSTLNLKTTSGNTCRNI